MSGRSGEPRSLLSRTLWAAQAAIRLTTDGPEVHRVGGALVHSARWPSASAHSLRAEPRHCQPNLLAGDRSSSSLARYAEEEEAGGGGLRAVSDGCPKPPLERG